MGQFGYAVAEAGGRRVLGWLGVGMLSLVCLGAEGVRAEEQATGSYEIRIVTSDGKPAAGATMRAMGSEEELPPAIADDAGRVIVEDLKPGEPAFFLGISADGKQQMFMPVLVVPAGRRTITLRLYPPGVVRGELLDENGEPVQAALVRVSGWEWLKEPQLEGEAATDAGGRFEMHGLVAGAYYMVVAAQGPAEEPARTWRSSPFPLRGRDGTYDVGMLLPEGTEPTEERPAGTVVRRVASGPEDEWHDETEQGWRGAVETLDPNRAWAPAPEGAMWVWRAGRPTPEEEQYGGRVEMRRRFTLAEGIERAAGYLTIAVDDYAAIRLNGEWVGQANQYMRTVSMTVPAGLLRPGENELRLTVRNIPGTSRDYYNPTGVAYLLEVIE